MNTTLSLILLVIQNSLKKDINFTIGKYLIDNMDNISNMNVKMISDNCFTSTNSIIKFCQLLGYKGFTDFKYNLISSNQTRKMQLEEKLKNIDEHQLFDMFKMFCKNNIDKNELFRTIDNIIDKLIDEKTMYFYAAVFPINLIQSFCEDMIIMGNSMLFIQTPINHREIKKEKGIHTIITLSGRYIDNHRNEFNSIIENNDNVLLISKRNIEYVNQIVMPQTISSEYDDILLLLLFDIIKYKYYMKVGLKN